MLNSICWIKSADPNEAIRNNWQKYMLVSFLLPIQKTLHMHMPVSLWLYRKASTSPPAPPVIQRELIKLMLC